LSASDSRNPIQQIDRHLEVIVRSLVLPPNLVEAIAYATLSGGKRIRPLLAWHACAAMGTPGDRSLNVGSAVEFVHAFSLVHDDLPALDNDNLRRGKPTLHIHAGEPMAILAGDALLALAFDLLSRHVAEPTIAGMLVAELSRAAAGMIAGQVYDTLGGFAQGFTDRERLELIHRNKTGALIRAACRMGAIIGIADEALEQGISGARVPAIRIPAGQVASDLRLGAITRYGECVGLMFQIVDDLLDVESSPMQAGKRTGKDSGAGKLTYPELLGLEGSKQEVKRLMGTALEALAPLGARAEGLAQVARAMAERRR
jgi:geranylgeranyl diphosphate synthase, type II